MRSITTYVVLSVCLSVCSGVAIQVVDGAYAPPVRKIYNFSDYCFNCLSLFVQSFRRYDMS